MFNYMADYSINSWMRTDKPLKRNGKFPVYLRIRVRGKETKLPTGIDVYPNQWDAKRNEPKDKPLQIQLSKKRNEIEVFINRTLADDQDISLEMVKDFYNGKKKIRPESQSFYKYYLNFVERKKKENLDKETIRVYMTTYNVLKEFKPEFRISDLTLSFVEEFDDFMAEQRGNEPGGRNPKHKNLRTVILDMIKHDIPIKNPYALFKMPHPSTKEVYLNKEELGKMRALRSKYPHTSTTYQVLQMYLFACYCGLRFSDVIDLKWQNIDFDKKIISKEMIKTRHSVITPLFTMARAVVLELSDGKKLFGSPKRVFHRYSETTINRTLRELAEQAGIEKHITFHSSRHTFATLLVQDGVPVVSISKYLGHKSLEMTNRYLKYNLSVAIETAKNIKTFG